MRNEHKGGGNGSFAGNDEQQHSNVYREQSCHFDKENKEFLAVRAANAAKLFGQ